MKKITAAAILSAFVTSVCFSQTGNVGLNTTTPLAMFHVKDSSVLFTGRSEPLPNAGNPPVSGAGTRMMWYADKAAFRSGLVHTDSWDKIKVGGLSFAANEDTEASGWGSTAFGCFARATNSYAFRHWLCDGGQWKEFILDGHSNKGKRRKFYCDGLPYNH
jgi:hypothetical protein